jgi:monovalent cation/proton antiporter MnhG/PhaG subunit
LIGTVAGVVAAAVLLLGLLLASIGLYGMLRKPAIFEQLHAAGLVTGPGVILVLLASLASASAEIATSAVLVAAFVLVTSSLSTHAIALAAWRLRTETSQRHGAVGAGHRDDSASEAVRSPTALRVVLAHDASPGADVAISLVASLPWAQGSIIHLIGAIEGDIQPLSAADAPGQPAEPLDLSAVLEMAAGRLRRPGLTVDHTILRGDPGTAIAAEAERLGAELVVIGSRGLDPVRALFQGSVAAAVVDAAPCPVLVARTPRIHDVLLAIDGSTLSDGAIEAVTMWPIFADVDVRVLTVAAAARPYGDRPGPLDTRGTTGAAPHEAAAEAAAATLREAGRRAVPFVRAGGAASTILAFAQAERIDLIVLGSRGRTGLRRVLLGSVGRDVLSSAKTSVLIVPGASRRAARLVPPGDA